MRPNSPADFFRFINKTDGCWLWTGATSGYRYGRFNLRGHYLKAHRFSWEYHNGQIPNEMHVLHRCDNGLCVRPDHLFLGTHQDNMRDRTAKGRTRPVYGSKNHLSKLTEHQVQQIRKRYADGARQVDLAAEFNVYQTTISKIVTRKAWAHI